MSQYCFEMRFVVKAQTQQSALRKAYKYGMQVQRGNVEEVRVVPFRGYIFKAMGKTEQSMKHFADLLHDAREEVHPDRDNNKQAKREFQRDMPAPIKKTRRIVH